MGLGNRHTIWKKRTMTTFEVAAHFLQQSMLLAQHPIVWVTAAVYFAGCALIGVEFWIIRRELNERDKALDIRMKQAVDSGKALDALMKRTEDSSKTLDVLMKRAEDDGLALRTLIERTSK